jgi:hypothetical protein
VVVPAVGCEPFQCPLALHDIAFCDDQVSIDACPTASGLGLAARLTVGAATFEPPPPPQLNESPRRTVSKIILTLTVRMFSSSVSEFFPPG